MTSAEDTEFSCELRIPKDRVAVLIGTKGAQKRKLEALTKTKIDVSSQEGEVIIQDKDALSIYSAKEIVRAIGRGFNPDIAQFLLKQDYAFELINIMDYGKTKADLKRLSGRIIGHEGKARRTVEDLTGVHISVYGKTVALIGEITAVAMARKAIDALLAGAQHANVYRMLERQRRELRRKDIAEVL